MSRCDCGDSECPSCGRAQGTYSAVVRTHTQGPWVHATDLGQIGSVESVDGQVIAQAQQILGDDKHTIRSANARLIAAAPELARLLKEAENLAVLGDIQEEEEVYGWGQWLRETRAALTKAGVL